MIHYIVQIIAFQLLFLAVYDLFLKKETFFNYNRAYLLITPVISLLLPFIKVSAISQNAPKQLIDQLGATSQVIQLDPITVMTTQNVWSTSEKLMAIYILGVVVSVGILIYKGYRLFQLVRIANRKNIQGINVMQLPDTDVAFSFFKTMFLGTDISEKQKSIIFLHEKIHIEQRHSLDLMFFELLRIVFWFNPLIYIFQNRVTLLQEFIADHKVALTQSKEYYCESILSQAFQTENISFINTFFNHSFIKKRIIMLQKSKSNRVLQLKYLLLVPLVFGMLIYTSCSDDRTALNDSANFTSSSDSEIIRNIETLKNSIAKNGNLTEEEEKALKVLYAVTSSDVVIDESYNDVANDLNIPFGVIEKVPVFPGCENLSKKEAKSCFSRKLSQFVNNEFDPEIAKNHEMTGNHKIYVKFKIDKTGQVTDIKVNTDNATLKAEAERIANKLPKMTPGELNGMKVSVLYDLPISFQINE